MAKKKPLYGVSNYHKRTPKKRPGVHTKRLNKRKPHRKKYKGQGRQFRIILKYETHNDHFNVFNFWWRHQVRQL